MPSITITPEIRDLAAGWRRDDGSALDMLYQAQPGAEVFLNKFSAKSLQDELEWAMDRAKYGFTSERGTVIGPQYDSLQRLEALWEQVVA